MLLCITKIDDLVEVRATLNDIADSLNIPFEQRNAPEMSELADIVKEVKIIFMNPNRSHITFNRDTLEKFSSLKVLCTASTGTVHIDMDAAREFGIEVISIKRYQSVLRTIPSTAELALGLTMDGLRKITRSHNHAVNDFTWNFENYIGKQLQDSHVGVLGYGRLGKIYCDRLKGSGAKISILDPRLSLDFNKDLEVFINKCPEFDVVALHIHAEGNEKFIDETFFKRMKNDVVLVNTSRGEIVDHEALFKFLDGHPDAFYCTDVIPAESDDRLRMQILKEFKVRENIIVTQHIGGMSSGARQTAFGLAANLLKEYYGKVGS
ncbi:NAD(P)-dependent oxidoreductase [Neptuniibacter caesariensis]|uniref:Phosphoglycerate dehydrogenase n=1 Tax=Neptuniibacter caesariensis TaxID=207954 RepID=A0A7U8C3G8_NEPCE|nr:NAD(P)-dependent oxidoreductase [Neptuniibacter caesariensis]EAR60524.1 phosphoglycerate dehydrogenase [Oceanospirillum sp. MED92] [Neptuniibacter caesariensis]